MFTKVTLISMENGSKRRDWRRRADELGGHAEEYRAAQMMSLGLGRKSSEGGGECRVLGAWGLNRVLISLYLSLPWEFCHMNQPFPLEALCFSK